MANRKITVLNPAGYQELFQSGDNLIVDGAVNLQSNGLTGVPNPAANLDAANKFYVDAGDTVNSGNITTNTNAISANTNAISTNANNISTNTNSISTNTNGISTNTSDISALDTRLTTAEGDITAIPAANNPQIDITGSTGITVTGGSFTLNQAGAATIDIAGPDISSFISEPTTDGTFVLTQSGTTTSYTDTIDGGTY